MKRIVMSVTAAVAAFAFPHPGSAAVDPCKLVTSADAAKALAAPVTQTTTRSIGGSNSCTYHTAAPPRLTVTTEPFASPAEAKSEFHAMVTSPMTQAAPSSVEPGIGDEAQRLGPSIYVRKGSNIYVFTLLAKDGNGTGAARTIALAKTSAAHAP
jgi:hypothetical protein